MRPLRIALLCHYYDGTAGTILAHIHGIAKYSRHNVTPISFLGHLPSDFNLNRFDALIIHYSLIACSDNYIAPPVRAAISAFKGLKIAFIQDEYRFIHRTWDALRGLGVNVLFTCVPDEEIEKVYPSEALPGLVKVNVMTGYVDEALPTMTVPPYAERPIDVGYRARKLPYWMGKLAVEKWRISERFAEDAPRYGLKTDVSYREEDRIYGEDWNKFITSCKAMLGVESGVSVFDFDGTLQTRLEALELANPEMTFDEMYERHLKDFDGLIRLNQISPRCFEAAALRTLMILYEGDYSGCLKPWRHFVPLKKDHSNMDEVVAVLRDTARAQEIIDNAYREVALNPAYSFAAAVAQFDTVIDQNMKPAMRSTLRPYSALELKFVFWKVNVRLDLTGAAVRLVARTINFALLAVSEKRRERLRSAMREWYWLLSTVRRMAGHVGLRAAMGLRPHKTLRKIACQALETNCEFVYASAIRAHLAGTPNARLHLAKEGSVLNIRTDREAGPGLPGCAALREMLADVTHIHWVPPQSLPSSTVRDFPNLAAVAKSDPNLVIDFLFWLAEGAKSH